jgi:hypothetical protein
MATTSIYRPLNTQTQEIPLLRITDDNDPSMKCELATFASCDAPEYEALSYQWGEGDVECAIEVNGQLFEVRDNLWRCLLIGLSEEDHDWLYVDAICINQEDLDEQTSQVTSMGEVYRRADAVIAWLSASLPNPLTDPETLAERRSILEHVENTADTGDLRAWKTLVPDPENPDLRRFEMLKDISPMLFGSTYSKRLWIVQELLLARMVVFRVHQLQLSEEIVEFLQTI